MNQADYLAAVDPPQFRILGLNLRPFSLGHKTTLARYESPFETGIRPPDEADLLLAVAICSMSYEEGQRFIADEYSTAQIKKWIRKATSHKFWLLKAQQPFDLNEKLLLFVDYMRQHSKMPGWCAKEGSVSEKSETPPIADVRVMLLSHLNLTESEIYNRCWSLCLWDYLIIKEQLGYLKVRDDEKVKAHIAAADEFQRDLMAGKIKV